MTWTNPAYEAVADLLVRRTGLVFGPTRRDSAEAGMRRAMGRAGVRDPERYRELLETDATVLDDLVVELTVGETYFFREPAQFQFLRREALPDLLRRQGPDTAVRAWSAGCASGEEAYSLAILLEEEGAGSRAHLLATDISRAALARARRAVYGTWSLRGEGASAAAPYLQPSGGRFVVSEAIRRRVRFEYLNLALDVYPSLPTDTWGMHVVLCRNVLIYFNAETIQAVARRLYETLAPGGWLLTAASDPPLAGHARFETVTTEAGVLYRRGVGAMFRLFPAAPELGHGDTGTRGQGELRALLLPPPSLAPAEWFPAPLSPCPLVPLSPPPPPVPSPPAADKPAEAPDPLAEARQAMADGDYERAAGLTAERPDDAAACALHVRALANFDAARGEQACAEATIRHPLSTELHYLHGVFLVSLGRDGEAARAVRRVLYLDRSLAVAHFTLGSILERAGDPAGARRAYRNARDLCRARPADEPAPLSDGEPAGRLAEAAAAQLAILDAPEEKAS